MILRALKIHDEVAALQGHSELAEENWEFLLNYRDEMTWMTYLKMLENEAAGVNILEGRVPATFMIAEQDGELVGRASIRHSLNDYLFKVGGHIGYGVRPAFRNRGFATEILKQSLLRICGLGISKVLVTCADDNLGSVRVIESQGGVLENKIDSEGKVIRRYWISGVK